MRIVERRNGLVGLLVGLALFCVALPASAQDARLKLDHLEKLSAKVAWLASGMEIGRETSLGACSRWPTAMPMSRRHTSTTGVPPP